jgi:hypothetical protein
MYEQSYEQSNVRSECPGQWKLDVNDRYQHAVGIVTNLATAALVLPVLFLKDILGLSEAQSIANAFNAWAYTGWLLLASSILAAVVYYYSSAKWVKLAWNRQADMFGKPVSEGFVENALDISYFVMMGGFVTGVGAILIYMLTYTRG